MKVWVVEFYDWANIEFSTAFVCISLESAIKSLWNEIHTEVMFNIEDELKMGTAEDELPDENCGWVTWQWNPKAEALIVEDPNGEVSYAIKEMEVVDARENLDRRRSADQA